MIVYAAMDHDGTVYALFPTRAEARHYCVGPEGQEVGARRTCGRKADNRWRIAWRNEARGSLVMNLILFTFGLVALFLVGTFVLSIYCRIRFDDESAERLELGAWLAEEVRQSVNFGSVFFLRLSHLDREPVRGLLELVHEGQERAGVHGLRTLIRGGAARPEADVAQGAGATEDVVSAILEAP